MKKFIIRVAALFMVTTLSAQQENIKVVFDVTSNDPNVQRSAARHLRLMSESYPDSEFEMVVYSDAYAMVDNSLSVAGETIREIVKQDNVSIVICQNTMKRNKKDESNLIPGVDTVPDGIYAIVLRQMQGWGYIKEGK